MFTLADALKALEGRTEFAVKRADGLVLINYIVGLPDSFEGIRENFRGVVFDEATGEIISLPLHKFFNANQTPSTQLHVIGDMTCDMFHKLDGSMCHALEVGGEVVLATRMGWETGVAKAATEFLRASGWLPIVREQVQAGYTPIFEFTGPQNPVVISYRKAELSYLYSRCRRTGEYRRYPQLHGIGQAIAAECGVTVRSVVEQTASAEGIEGYVLHTRGGPWVKVKTPWYLDRHRVLDSFHLPAWKVYGYALDDKLDDLLAFARPEDRARLEAIQSEVGRDQLDLLRSVREGYTAIISGLRDLPPASREHRKGFAIAARERFPAEFGGLMIYYEGREVLSWVKEHLRGRYREKYPQRLLEGVEIEAG